MARLLEKYFVLESRYFNRMWTLQEGATSTMIAVQHGGSVVDLRSVIRTILYLEAKQKMHVFDESTIETITTLWVIKRVWGARYRLNLREPFPQCRLRACHDDKDLVYSLLGLIYEREDPRLQPDKTKSVSELFANATQVIAYSERCLDIIFCAGYDEKPYELPSWSPHFRQFGISNGVVSLIGASGHTSIFNVSSKESHTTSDIQTTATQSHQILKVTGLFLGTIQSLSQKSELDESVDQVEKQWNITDED